MALVEEADVVLLDVRMPQMDGVAAMRDLVVRHPGPGVIILTTFDDEYVFEGLKAGARVYADAGIAHGYEGEGALDALERIISPGV